MIRYDKIIFVCTGNTFMSPVAEAIYREKAPVWMPTPYSRGLVVLFQEPISPKVNLLLSKHEIQASDHAQSKQLEAEEITESTLLLTMTLSEKVQLMEEFGTEGHIYTMGEYTGEETDVTDPYGTEDEQYEKCFEELFGRIDLVIEKMDTEYHNGESKETVSEEEQQNGGQDDSIGQ